MIRVSFRSAAPQMHRSQLESRSCRTLWRVTGARCAVCGIHAALRLGGGGPGPLQVLAVKSAPRPRRASAAAVRALQDDGSDEEAVEGAAGAPRTAPPPQRPTVRGAALAATRSFQQARASLCPPSLTEPGQH